MSLLFHPKKEPHRSFFFLVQSNKKLLICRNPLGIGVLFVKQSNAIYF